MTEKKSVEVAKISDKPTALEKKVAELSKKIQKKTKRSRGWKIFFLALFGLGLAAWIGLVLFAVQYAIAFLLVKILPEDSLTSNVTNAVYQVIVYAAALFVAVFVPWKVLKYKTTRDEIGMRGLPTWTDILLAPIGFAVSLFAAGALTLTMKALLPDVNWEQVQEVGYNNLYQFSDFVMAFACLVILAPLCEEIIFRGWLYGKLRFRMPALPAMLIVSVLFGIMHGQWNVGVTVFAMSICMCILREFTGTIWAGVLLHMIKNGVAFYFLFVI
jgi:membrane protease YdiL (CAAX protease family)